MIKRPAYFIISIIYSTLLFKRLLISSRIQASATKALHLPSTQTQARLLQLHWEDDDPCIPLHVDSTLMSFRVFANCDRARLLTVAHGDRVLQHHEPAKNGVTDKWRNVFACAGNTTFQNSIA